MSKRLTGLQGSSLRGLAAVCALYSSIAWPSDGQFEARIKGLLLVAGWIDNLLIATVLLSGLVLVRKFSAKTELEFPLTKITLPIKALAVCFLSLTVAHAYLSWLYYRHTDFFVNDVLRTYRDANPGNDPSDCPLISGKATESFKEAFVTLTGQGGLLLNGLKDSHVSYKSSCTKSATNLKFRDPPTLLYVLGLTVMGMSVIKVYRLGATRKKKLLFSGFAVILVALNWQVGSFWVGSTLALDTSNPSRFFLSWPISAVFR